MSEYESDSSLKSALISKGSDDISFYYKMGLLAEAEGLPTISLTFLTEALQKHQNGMKSSDYTTQDISLAISRLKNNNPGLIDPSVVTLTVESKRTLGVLLQDILQNTVVKSVSLLITGSLIPIILSAVL